MLDPEQDETRRQDLLVSLYREMGDGRRIRILIESSYAAAFIAASGALCWGVAAVSPATFMPATWPLSPAVASAVGLTINAAIVTTIIWGNHRVHDSLKEHQNALLDLLGTPPAQTVKLPPGLMDRGRGGQRVYLTITLLWTAVAGADWFCIAIAFGRAATAH